MIPVTETSKDIFVLENDNLKVKIQGGVITSLIDIATNREIIPQGRKAGQLVIMDDKPLYWQAWDVSLPVYPLQAPFLPLNRLRFTISKLAKSFPPVVLLFWKAAP